MNNISGNVKTLDTSLIENHRAYALQSSKHSQDNANNPHTEGVKTAIGIM